MDNLPPGIKKRIAALCADNVHGSIYLAKCAASVLHDASPLSTSQQDVVVRCVLDAQPSMVQIANVANTALLNRERGIPFDETCAEYVAGMESRNSALVSHAADAVSGYASLVTYSSSGTVMAVLSTLAHSGRVPAVLCSESRPALEGIAFAEQLCEWGIPVRLCADMALFQEMRGFDAVLLGADALSPSGLVNKVGSSGIACMARDCDMPVIVACSTDKIVPRGYPHYRMDLRDRSEIYTGTKAVDVRNYYYDVTDLRHISTIVTERGASSPEQLLSVLPPQQLHPVISEYCDTHRV